MKDAISNRSEANKRYKAKYRDRIRARDREYQKRRAAALKEPKPLCTGCNKRTSVIGPLCCNCDRAEHPEAYRTTPATYGASVIPAPKGWGFLPCR